MSENIQSISQGNYILQGTVATSAGIVGDGSTQNPIRADETVLFSGTPTSAATLSESMQNFDYLRLYFDLGANDRPNPVITCRYSPVMTVSWAQGVANAFQTIAYISANPTAMKVVHSRQVALGSFTSTAAANTTGTLDSTNALNTITKVVGVNRINNA